MAVLLATVNCNRGLLTSVLTPLVTGVTYGVENASQSDNQVQYWGTAFQQTDEVSETRFPYDISSTVQLYRRCHRLPSLSYNTAFVGRITVWIPREYRFTFAIIRVFQL